MCQNASLNQRFALLEKEISDEKVLVHILQDRYRSRQA